MTTHQSVAARSTSVEPGPRLPPNCSAEARAEVASPRGDVAARLAALPTGTASILLGSADPSTFGRVRAYSRQTAGRERPGRPHVGRQEILGGFTVDLAKVFEREQTLWYALGFGTNALAVNVWLGTFERDINERLGVDATAVQTDALVFAPMTPGLQQAHGRLLFGRDGRVLYEAYDNRSVFEQLRTRTLYIPDVEEPAHHAPIDVAAGRPIPLQSGSALVPGAATDANDGSERSSLQVMRLFWKPFHYGGRQARR